MIKNIILQFTIMHLLHFCQGFDRKPMFEPGLYSSLNYGIIIRIKHEIGRR